MQNCQNVRWSDDNGNVDIDAYDNIFTYNGICQKVVSKMEAEIVKCIVSFLAGVVVGLMCGMLFQMVH